MEKIKGYTLEEKIGKGGMALVYRGIQTSLNRPVAIKVLLKNYHPTQKSLNGLTVNP